MNFKGTNAAKTTVTRDTVEFISDTENIYKSLVVISKRAKQINNEIKEELTQKLAEFATTTDTLEEVFENREQIEISKFYERLPKPSSLAIEEFIEGKIYLRESENTKNIEE
jgi:DNA-directed RNA polymerase subunit K/omega